MALQGSDAGFGAQALLEKDLASIKPLHTHTACPKQLEWFNFEFHMHPASLGRVMGGARQPSNSYKQVQQNFRSTVDYPASEIGKKGVGREQGARVSMMRTPRVQ